MTTTKELKALRALDQAREKQQVEKNLFTAYAVTTTGLFAATIAGIALTWWVHVGFSGVIIVAGILCVITFIMTTIQYGENYADARKAVRTAGYDYEDAIIAAQEN
ncbi:hypothetical protein [Rhodococcus opacus]|uniref:Hypothetical membrane protein n=1 Tax=Rhodococcus opacus (strain B4) TaxID=632772 RepID=C1B9B7_RHOOB|nr:hypothetical protein [Rhodococcus opacus]BAH52270.1 hypothetical membrane protein [Rhodococcus opacus B4]